MLNNQLREGSSHCNCEGARQWLEQTLKMAEKATPHRRLLVTDDGLKWSITSKWWIRRPTPTLSIKRNLRTDDPVEWLELAKHQSE